MRCPQAARQTRDISLLSLPLSSPDESSLRGPLSTPSMPPSPLLETGTAVTPQEHAVPPGRPANPWYFPPVSPLSSSDESSLKQPLSTPSMSPCPLRVTETVVAPQEHAMPQSNHGR
eukprot:TRINITY_DN13953_c0_g4_i1.p1 TRINITY_DN13953_c0_g4~~TRINITY_DN13953_c0_g4_i1.p1  ORF type:complete len:117 (-),score=13.25 TRINITY_DN13953_c0_g4_i1:15-365(-)